MPRFLGEVRRVLKPGGWFLFADFRKREEMPLCAGSWWKPGSK